jgi:hypothetical protein
MTRLHDAFPIYRISCTSWLPVGWDQDILECSRVHRELRYLGGESATSRQRQLGNAADFVVGVVQGKVVADELPWLVDFYRGAVLNLANGLSLGDFVCSSDIRSAININSIAPGNGYEWHVDTNPLTGLLFVTDQPKGSGGELVFRSDPVTRPDEWWELTVHPRFGDLLLFDAREAAHNVCPVLGASERISAPMNFYFADQDAARPDDLDTYLYGN